MFNLSRKTTPYEGFLNKMAKKKTKKVKEEKVEKVEKVEVKEFNCKWCKGSGLANQYHTCKVCEGTGKV